MVSSRGKGEEFEEAICKTLIRRFSTTEMPRKFQRTITNLPEDMKPCGDIAAVKDFRFSVDCRKGYSDGCLNNLFRKGSELGKSWKRAQTRAAKAGLEPMMIWQQDYRDTVAIVDIQHVPAHPEIEPIMCYPLGIAIIELSQLLKHTKDIYWFAS